MCAQCSWPALSLSFISGVSVIKMCMIPLASSLEIFLKTGNSLPDFNRIFQGEGHFFQEGNYSLRRKEKSLNLKSRCKIRNSINKFSQLFCELKTLQVRSRPPRSSNSILPTLVRWLLKLVLSYDCEKYDKANVTRVLGCTVGVASVTAFSNNLVHFFSDKRTLA